jgi:hypothetical protein
MIGALTHEKVMKTIFNLYKYLKNQFYRQFISPKVRFTTMHKVHLLKLLKGLFFKQCLGLIPFFLTSPLYAGDLFAFLLKDCQLQLGLPIASENQHLTVLKPDGNIRTFSKDSIEGVAFYQIPEFQFRLAHLDREKLQHMKRLEVKDSDLVIYGFAYQFVEGTIFILDKQGARRVIGLDEIGRVTSLNEANAPLLTPSSTQVIPSLSFPSGLAECKGQKKGLLPVRYLSDKIQILETLQVWERGFRELNDLAERSQFYPRPYLFDRYDRFGFISFKNSPLIEQSLPIRYVFSNGEDFRFQGLTTLGGTFDTFGPRMDPQSLLKSDLKFHFLRVSFQGNLNAMGVGSSYYKKNRGSNENAEEKPTQVVGDQHFNHMALLGVDWQGWSVAFGPYFPIFYVQVGGESRELNAQKSLPVVQLAFTSEKWKWSLSAVNGQLKADSDMKRKSTILRDINNTLNNNEPVDSFTINTQFIRSSFEWDFHTDMQLQASLLVSDWDYSEKLDGEPLDYNYQERILSLMIQKNFSQYLALSIFGLQIDSTHKGKSPAYGTNLKNKDNQFKLGGSLDFLF